MYYLYYTLGERTICKLGMDSQLQVVINQATRYLNNQLRMHPSTATFTIVEETTIEDVKLDAAIALEKQGKNIVKWIRSMKEAAVDNHVKDLIKAETEGPPLDDYQKGIYDGKMSAYTTVLAALVARYGS